MNENEEKTILLVLLLVVLLIISGQEIKAEEYVEEVTTEVMANEETRGDEIIIKYRLYNGILQYRHWNVTKNRWVEPEWISL